MKSLQFGFPYHIAASLLVDVIKSAPQLASLVIRNVPHPSDSVGDVTRLLMRAWEERACDASIRYDEETHSLTLERPDVEPSPFPRDHVLPLPRTPPTTEEGPRGRKETVRDGS